MRGFFLAFPKCDALSRELSWTHYRLLLRVDAPEARQWYMQEAAAQNWNQYIGQMDMYVRLYDDLRRSESDNPTVGILLCGSKDQSVVRYSVLHDSENLFASKYRLVLPSEEELRQELERDARTLAADAEIKEKND